MDKLRNAMEAAIEQHWHAPLHPVDSQSKVPRQLHVASDKDRSPRLIDVLPETLFRHRVVAALHDSIERDAYRLLQAAVSERLRAASYSVIGVTGPGPGAGTTLTAANLAVSLAVDARRPTILIDLNLRAPAIRELFGAAAGVGVEDCVFDTSLVRTALFSPGLDRLAVLPARGGSPSASNILRSSGLRELLDVISREYPGWLLLADLPPVTNAEDARMIDALVDGVLLVIRDGVTRERDYRRVLDSIAQRKLLGTVLNAASRR
jgi:Mrp family chromosome partitioning ATPase